MNVPEGFLDPVKDKEPQTSEQELTEKVEKTILPRHQAVFQTQTKEWADEDLGCGSLAKALKRKYFSVGMAKEACKFFQVRAKQLSRVLMGHKYLGAKKTPAQRGKKRKDVPPADTTKGTKKSRDNRGKPLN